MAERINKPDPVEIAKKIKVKRDKQRESKAREQVEIIAALKEGKEKHRNREAAKDLSPGKKKIREARKQEAAKDLSTSKSNSREARNQEQSKISENLKEVAKPTPVGDNGESAREAEALAAQQRQDEALAELTDMDYAQLKERAKIRGIKVGEKKGSELAKTILKAESQL